MGLFSGCFTAHTYGGGKADFGEKGQTDGEHFGLNQAQPVWLHFGFSWSAF